MKEDDFERESPHKKISFIMVQFNFQLNSELICTVLFFQC